MNSIKDLLINPQVFFSGLSEKPVSLKLPALITLINGILAVITAVYVTVVVLNAMPSEISGLNGIICAFTAVMTLIVTFIVWVIIAAIFHGITAVMGGVGYFKRTLEVVGYATIPQIFSGVISTILFIVHISSVKIPTITSPADATLIQSAVSGGMLITAGTIIGILFTLWSANILIFGFKECRKMELKKSVIAVGIPVILYIIFTLVTLLLA